MAKQVIEVEVPDGWEAVAYRCPETGEHYLTACDSVCCATAGNTHDAPWLIVRPQWQWPAWLKAPWIAMDASGNWHAYAQEPWRGEQHWYGTTGCVAFARLCPDCIDFTPPPVADWRLSKRKNPNA